MTHMNFSSITSKQGKSVARKKQQTLKQAARTKPQDSCTGIIAKNMIIIKDLFLQTVNWQGNGRLDSVLSFAFKIILFLSEFFLILLLQKSDSHCFWLQR